MLRRLTLTAAASVAALAPTPATAHNPDPVPEPAEDHLTITVSNTGHATDGTFHLYCHPSTGTHPEPGSACDELDEKTVWGKSPFAPDSGPGERMCTMIYGGPATAHVTGTWAGRPVDARFDRSDGCQIERWDALVPVLPDLRAEDQDTHGPSTHEPGTHGPSTHGPSTHGPGTHEPAGHSPLPGAHRLGQAPVNHPPRQRSQHATGDHVQVSGAGPKGRHGSFTGS